MNFKGQGALEYLLMIGGGLAVAAIVLVFLFQGIQGNTCSNAKKQVESLCNANPDSVSCTSSITGDVSQNWPGSVDCTWYVNATTGESKCISKRTAIEWSGFSGCP
ncbi:MAG: hypothetical protein NT067_05980 [Candidatus Diapherotrites archaeon]|nr:hypothetical protein [Candidatus Diapherotrites archaeon]